MLAIACAIRNRKTLSGVYGLHAPRVRHKNYSQHTYRMAERAWYQSERIDITNGATNWYSGNKIPYWVKSMKLVYIHADHKFFRKG